MTAERYGEQCGRAVGGRDKRVAVTSLVAPAASARRDVKHGDRDENAARSLRATRLKQLCQQLPLYMPVYTPLPLLPGRIHSQLAAAWRPHTRSKAPYPTRCRIIRSLAVSRSSPSAALYLALRRAIWSLHTSVIRNFRVARMRSEAD